ncbi:hypothetical protein VN97_g11807 [Penicillium thymicola]|uniref:Uncharacterized protein n=1 Tax=Penicillium thymicola TaxID=293382 RepID=A0AAI9X2K5_PENTH|nr:hypothetical protein VN97_g11807 [Penicillium thymicola]
MKDRGFWGGGRRLIGVCRTPCWTWNPCNLAVLPPKDQKNKNKKSVSSLRPSKEREKQRKTEKNREQRLVNRNGKEISQLAN